MRNEVCEGSFLLAPSWMCWMPDVVWLFDSDLRGFDEDTEETGYFRSSNEGCLHW